MSGTLRYESATEIRIPVPWGHISGKAWGAPNKIPVLALHGWMDNAGTFDRLVPLLSNAFYVVAPDLPGHGLSSHYPPGMPYHFGDYLLSVKRIVKFLKWSRFCIVGHSMGGGLGVFFASMYPDMVERLVMFDIIKPMSSDDGSSSTHMASAFDEFLTVEEKISPDLSPSYPFEDALRRLISATDDTLTEEAAKCLMPRGTIRVDEDKWSFRRDLRVRTPSIYTFTHEASMNFLKTIKCHLLLIKSKDFPMFGGPPEVIKKTLEIYKEKCASFQFVKVEGNHFVHLNEPENVAELTNQFLLSCSIGKSGL